MRRKCRRNGKSQPCGRRNVATTVANEHRCNPPPPRHPERRRSRSRRIFAFTKCPAVIRCEDLSTSLRSARDDTGSRKAFLPPRPLLGTPKRPPCVKGRFPRQRGKCPQSGQKGRGPGRAGKNLRFLNGGLCHIDTVQSLRFRFAQPPPFTQGRLFSDVHLSFRVIPSQCAHWRGNPLPCRL